MDRHGYNIPKVSVCGSRIFPIFCFFSHNFGSIYASMTVKSSNDSDDGLESKKFLNQKNGHWGRGLGPGNLSHAIAKTFHHYDVTRREPQTQNEKKIF